MLQTTDAPLRIPVEFTLHTKVLALQNVSPYRAAIRVNVGG